MGKIFRVDGPLFQKLSVITDLMIANILFLLSSIPVFTIGAAFAGLQKICMDKAMEDEQTVVKPFFRAFQVNFKQATISYWICFLINVILLWYFLFVPQILSGVQLAIVNAAALILFVIMNGVWCYLLPLIVRYENPLKEHIKNALVLTMAHLPRTILMVLVSLVPLAMVLLSVEFFLRTFIFWLLIGAALIRLCCCVIIKPVIEGFDPKKETGEESEKESKMGGGVQ